MSCNRSTRTLTDFQQDAAGIARHEYGWTLPPSWENSRVSGAQARFNRLCTELIQSIRVSGHVNKVPFVALFLGAESCLPAAKRIVRLAYPKPVAWLAVGARYLAGQRIVVALEQPPQRGVAVLKSPARRVIDLTGAANKINRPCTAGLNNAPRLRFDLGQLWRAPSRRSLRLDVLSQCLLCCGDGGAFMPLVPHIRSVN